MKYKKEVIVLKDKWNPGAHDVPEARTLEMTEVAPNTYMDAPFPLSLYNTQNARKGTIIRCRL